MEHTPATLLLSWEHQVTLLTAEATRMRDNGMLETAAVIRARRDTLKSCAESLRAVIGPMADADAPLLAQLRSEDSPTTPPSPSPHALHLASSLSKPTLRMLAGLPQGRHLEGLCNTIAGSRGEAEPPAALDLQAAAIHLTAQSTGTPHLPPQSQALAESPAMQAAAPVVQAAPVAPAQHPTGEGSQSKSPSSEPSSDHPAHKQAFEQAQAA